MYMDTMYMDTMYMDTIIINKLRNKYLKTIRKFNKQNKNNDIELPNVINYLNQIYFINQTLAKMESEISILNTCLNNKTTINQKKKIEYDNKNIEIEKIKQDNIKEQIIKPFIIANLIYPKLL